MLKLVKVIHVIAVSVLGNTPEIVRRREQNGQVVRGGQPRVQSGAKRSTQN